jgi:biotin carboxyl carrier protein
MEKKEAEKLNIDHTLYTTRLSRRFAGRKAYSPPRPGRIYSFIPGTVTEVLVRQGDMVNAGDDIVILDAMKMKNRLKSHVTGKVAAVNVKPGDRVTKGMVLAEID